MKFILIILCLNQLLCQDIHRFQKNVRFYSSDDLMGRAYKSQGLDDASNHIKSSLEKLKIPKVFKQIQNYKNKELKNVVAIIPSETKSENSIVFTAHMDGLGIGKANAAGDSIYNGALDNAVGIAALIEFAAYIVRNPNPNINYIFAFISPEEIGLEGSEYFLNHYPFPKNKIKMVFNCDGFNVFGKMANYTIMPKSGVSFYKTISKIIKKK